MELPIFIDGKRTGTLSLSQQGRFWRAEAQLGDLGRVARLSVYGRGGSVYLFTTGDIQGVEDVENLTVCRMPVEKGFSAVYAEAVCLQLLAYETAKRMGLPIDTPRNLAKSVTVA